MIIDTSKKIENEKVLLRPVAVNDVTAEYRDWLNDPEVNKYIEIRFTEHTIETTKDYVKHAISDPDTLFFAIIRKDSNKFIGTIKLGGIYWDHGFGNVSLMIGDKNSWGRGYATEAISLLSEYAFKHLKMHKLIAGAYEVNTGSFKAFLKVGYSEESRQKKQYLFNGEYIDCIVLTKFSA